MLRSRSGFVDIRRVRVRMSLRRGYPQRGVQSPLLLWNMMVDSLLNRLEDCNCFVQGFRGSFSVPHLRFNAKGIKLCTKLVR
jgi:hypothetical protein